ncbi:MAG TPA: ATP synthase subunit I [Acidimicrobiales bacterium]|nr:ATP synthase subunit I [Acidimicrobiales bacterium]
MTGVQRLAEAGDVEFASPVEREVVFDMIRRSLVGLPVPIVAAALVWGWKGALSAAFALGLVLLNFLLSAAMLGWAARVSLPVLMATALFGFFVRLGLVAVLILAVQHQSWVEMVPLCITVLVAHLGLLIWETRHVSASLAFPGVAPRRPRRS